MSMTNITRRGALRLATAGASLAAPALSSLWAWSTTAVAASAAHEPLVDADWLRRQRSDQVLLIDASPAPFVRRQRIEGAVHADLFSFGGRDVANDVWQQRLQRWGVDPSRTVVIYDQDGMMWATRLFFDLAYLGFPIERLRLLDGGLAAWRAAGGTVTAEAPPAPAPGRFVVSRRREELHARLPEMLQASGEPARVTLVDALEPSHYFGGARFFDRAGHLPNARSWPRQKLFDATGRFKPRDELRRMATHLGLDPARPVYTYCGGGIAATLPFFVLKFLLGYPDVRVHIGSLLEWQRDDRGLPMWTYARPLLMRDADWVQGWGGALLRSVGMSQLSVVDLRPAADYAQGHLPYALHLPAERFREHLRDPAALAPALGAAGVDPQHEVVLVSGGGLTGDAAVAYAVLESLGQPRISILKESVDEWALRGHPLAKEPTVVGQRRSPQDLVVPERSYVARATPGALLRPATDGLYPRLALAPGRQAPARRPQGTVVHLPYAELLESDGRPMAAHALWTRLDKAGLTRWAAVDCTADDPADAAAGAWLLRLMGFPDVRIAV